MVIVSGVILWALREAFRVAGATAHWWSWRRTRGEPADVRAS